MDLGDCDQDCEYCGALFGMRNAWKDILQIEKLNTTDVVEVVELGYHFKDTLHR